MSKAMELAISQRISNHVLYKAMCKGDLPQRSIHPGKKKPVIGQGYSYHGAVNID